MLYKLALVVPSGVFFEPIVLLRDLDVYVSLAIVTLILHSLSSP